MNAATPDPRITWIIRYLQARLDSPVPVTHLARMVNLSESRFRALFLAQTGLAPRQYVQRLQLRRARLLLERTFLSVNEVMTLVGYNDPAHFARDFRRLHGAPPSDMRAAGDPQPGSPSLNPPTHTRIGPPRGRDPGGSRASSGSDASWCRVTSQEVAAAAGTTTSVGHTISLPAAIGNTTCQILHLDLGPLNRFAFWQPE